MLRRFDAADASVWARRCGRSDAAIRRRPRSRSQRPGERLQSGSWRKDTDVSSRAEGRAWQTRLMSRRLLAFLGCAGVAAAPAAAAPAPIVVSSPAAGATVSSPARVAGTADVFEATFQLEVRAHGKLVSSRTVHATSGTGTRGTVGGHASACRRATSRWSPTRPRRRTAPTSTSCASRCTSADRNRPSLGLQWPAERSPVAQLAEHSAVNRRVVGSSPTRGAS